MLLSMPSEIQRNIAFEADHRTRQRLRRTCKLLSDVATPIVFGAVYVDLSWTQHSNSSLIFLQSLISGPKLAQYIHHLTLFLPKSSGRNHYRFSSEAQVKKREVKLNSFNEMFLGAIPSMGSMRSLLWVFLGFRYFIDLDQVDHSWTSYVDTGPDYAKLMFERFGRLPLLFSLKIYSLGEWDIPWSPFPDIRDITYWGNSDSELPGFLAYSPNIESINFYAWRRPSQGDESPKRQSILSLFSSWPSGTYSTVKTLKMHSHQCSRLYAHEMPTLIRHLRYLENLHTCVTIQFIPDEFWDRLRQEGIYLRSLSHRQQSVQRTLLSYLVSYTGLRELSLDIWGESTLNDLQMASLLVNIIASHSRSLTIVHIKPSRSGPWCLDHPMLDALELCHSLQSLHVHVDAAKTRMDVNNVIDRILWGVVTLWPDIRVLKIHAVSQSFGFDVLRTTTGQIHTRILAFRFAPLPCERYGLLFSSDFARYSIKIQDKKNSILAFKVEFLKDWGKKDA
ncbi:hypothetical protein F5146DRAFT_1125796 [Armillaria mellea]|nr:hypothetical protein F5146DRAFT_1125796 [Armillaria mellea]